MTKPMRSLLLVIGVAQALFALAFFLQLPVATRLWPFPGTTPLTFIFVASIFAAAAASTLWAVVSDNGGALAGIALDYVAIFAPMTVLALQLRMTLFAVACVVAVAFGLWLLWWSIRIPIDDTIPMPEPVRWSFIVFIVGLVFFSTRLIFKVPNTIPWTITPDLSVVIGWIFLGSAIYFSYGLARPSWKNAAGQLAGFLAYDVVLIVPFLTRLPTATPEHRLGLTIYTAVVVYSGLLAVYYLFIHPPTRVWPVSAKPRLRVS